MVLTKDVLPERYRDTVEQFLAEHWQWHIQEITQAAMENKLAPSEPRNLLQSPVAHELCLIAQAAADKLEHCPENDDAVRKAIHNLGKRLFVPSFAPVGFTRLPGFRETSLGKMIARALLWLCQDDLISIAEAAKLLEVTHQAIKNAIKDRRLTEYINPDAPNPRRGRVLVSRSEVENMQQGSVNDN